MKFHVSNFDKPFITVHGHLWQLNPKVTSMETSYDTGKNTRQGMVRV